MRRLIGALAMVAVMASASLGVLYARQRSHQPALPQRLYIMFLPGMCGPSSSDCVDRTVAATRGKATFHILITALAKAGVQYTPLYYGYNPDHPRYYAPDDTQQAISRSVMALDRQLRAARQRDPQAIFDLAGYSLGGVVAAGWTATLARPTPKIHGMLRYLHSIVTLDSPLRGVHATGYGIVAQFFGGAVWDDLQPDSAAIAAILALPQSWWLTRGHLHTVANTADRIVPPSEALLGAEHIVTDKTCSDTFLWFSLCHGAVMEDSHLGRFIACNWITSMDQCRATPTPTVTPSPTEVVTATASPTVTATGQAPLPPPAP